MQFLVVTFATVLTLANAVDHDRPASSEFVDKQQKILDVLSGISTHKLDSKYKDEHHEITFNKPEMFTDPSALEAFLRGYRRGMLPRDGTFTLNDYKSRHDTFSLFEIMYFAKDFDTFIEIAKWAKDELNAMQLAYAFSIAVLHRADCREIYLPPSYELYPHNYVPSDIMRQADIAALNGVEHRVFEVNNTGFEYSFYRDMISGSSKSHPRWVGHDMESRISYFREDPGLSHWYATAMAWLATWLSHTKHPGITFVNRGEILYQSHKWLLSRYNLERMSADLPFVVPFDWDKPLIGYNPKLSDPLGRPFSSRPDNMNPLKSNPAGFQYLGVVESRMHDAIDSGSYHDYKNSTVMKLEEATGIDVLGKMIFGERDGIGRYYYKPWFFLMLEAINDMVHSSNEREYSNTVFGKYMTVSRDPVFYQVLASMDDWFQTYYSTLNPYTAEEMGFPGVQVKGVEFDKLLTYFERWEYEITQGVAFRKPEDRENKKYLVSQPRLNHKPYLINITVESDRDQDAMIRIYFGPKNNIDVHEMSLNQARHAYVLALMIRTKLKTGMNVISKRSDDFIHHQQYESTRAFQERLDKNKKFGKPFHTKMMVNCGVPNNLILPRGSTSGRDYKVFVMVEPVNAVHTYEDVYTRCMVHLFVDQHKLTFPFDRPVPYPKAFLQPNMMFKDVKIYHKSDSL